MLGNSRILQNFELFFWNSGQNFAEIHEFPVRRTGYLLQDFQRCPLGWGGVGEWMYSGIAQLGGCVSILVFG